MRGRRPDQQESLLLYASGFPASTKESTHTPGRCSPSKQRAPRAWSIDQRQMTPWRSLDKTRPLSALAHMRVDPDDGLLIGRNDNGRKFRDSKLRSSVDPVPSIDDSAATTVHFIKTLQEQDGI